MDPSELMPRLRPHLDEIRECLEYHDEDADHEEGGGAHQPHYQRDDGDEDAAASRPTVPGTPRNSYRDFDRKAVVLVLFALCDPDKIPLCSHTINPENPQISTFPLSAFITYNMSEIKCFTPLDIPTSKVSGVNSALGLHPVSRPIEGRV